MQQLSQNLPGKTQLELNQQLSQLSMFYTHDRLLAELSQLTITSDVHACTACVECIYLPLLMDMSTTTNRW